MKFGLAFASSVGTDSRSALEIARLGESLGFDSIWGGEHVVRPAKIASPYPYTEDGEMPGDAETAIPDPLMGEEPLRPGAVGDDLDATPFVGTSLELMTPEWLVPGLPRFFFGAEVAGAFGSNRQPAQNGVPGTVGNPAPEVAQDSTSFGDDR